MGATISRGVPPYPRAKIFGNKILRGAAKLLFFKILA